MMMILSVADERGLIEALAKPNWEMDGTPQSMTPKNRMPQQRGGSGDTWKLA